MRFIIMLVTAVCVFFLWFRFLFQVFCPGVFCFRVSDATFGILEAFFLENLDASFSRLGCSGMTVPILTFLVPR